MPQWYGDNLDAHWDSLIGIVYVLEKIKIYKPEKKAAFELYNEVYKVIGVFEEATQEYSEFCLLLKCE